MDAAFGFQLDALVCLGDEDVEVKLVSAVDVRSFVSESGEVLWVSPHAVDHHDKMYELRGRHSEVEGSVLGFRAAVKRFTGGHAVCKEVRQAERGNRCRLDCVASPAGEAIVCVISSWSRQSGCPNIVMGVVDARPSAMLKIAQYVDDDVDVDVPSETLTFSLAASTRRGGNFMSTSN